MSLNSLKGKLISFDTETTGLNPWNSRVYKQYNMFPARPFAFSLSDYFGNTAFIRWDIEPKTRKVITVKRDVKALEEILGDPSIVKIGHNLAFDIRMTRISGLKFDWTRIHDTAILAHVLGGGVSPVFSFKLKDLSQYYLDIPKDDEIALLDSVKRARHEAKAKGWAIANKETHGEQYIKSDYWLGDKKLLEEYAVKDAQRTMGLYKLLCQTKENEPKSWEIYRQIEIPLLRTVYRLEKNGIRAYPEKTASLRKFYTDYVNTWRIKADKCGGKGINFNSPKQLEKIFCTKLGHKTKRKTKGGNPCLDADELLRMSETYPLAKAILECKAGQSMINKFLNSYDKLRTASNPSIIHPSFHQVGTRTSRFSSSDPNFQQLASPDSVKKKADIPLRPREAFGPRDGNFWYMPDYSQMEVWLFAFSAQDPILIKALLEGLDVHEFVGKLMFSHKSDWTPGKSPYRKKGKTIMFLKQYGGGAGAYMEFTGCSKDEAYSDLDLFNKKFPGVDKFINKITQKVSNDGYIETLFGRQLSVERSAAYTGVNYLIQGSCADIMKRAMVRLDRLFTIKYKNEVKLVLTVHDELAIEGPKRLLQSDLQHDIINAMQKDSSIVNIPVPLPVSMKLTETTWADAKEI